MPEFEEGLQGLREATGLALIVTATEQVGSTRTEHQVNTYFSTRDGLSRLELHTFRDRTSQRSMIGDGKQFWLYSTRRNTFEGVEYPTLPALLRRAQGVSTGLERLSLLLLNDLHGGRTGAWRPWLSLGNPTVERDRLTATVWVQEGNQEVEFLLVKRVPEAPFALREVRGAYGPTTSRTHWTMQILPNLVPADRTFTFAPPPGAKAVAGTLGKG